MTFGSLSRDLVKTFEDVARVGSAFPCGTWKGRACSRLACFRRFAFAFRMCLLLDSVLAWGAVWLPFREGFNGEGKFVNVAGIDVVDGIRQSRAERDELT